MQALGLAFRIPFQSSGIKTRSWFCARFLGPEPWPRKWARRRFQSDVAPPSATLSAHFMGRNPGPFFFESRGSQM